MSKIRIVFAAMVALCLASCATSPERAQQSQLAPDSSDGLIMLFVEPAPVDYQLNVLRFNEEGTALEANTFNAIYPFRVDEGTRGYLARRAPPGRYVITAVHQQGLWAVCFNQQTVAFDVKPGEVTYIGHFNPTLHLLQLQSLAQRSGRVTSNGQEVHFFEGIVPPRLAPISPDDLLAARTYVTQSMPGVTAPVHAAEIAPAQFGIGHSFYGGGQVCGGYRERPIGSVD